MPWRASSSLGPPNASPESISERLTGRFLIANRFAQLQHGDRENELAVSELTANKAENVTLSTRRMALERINRILQSGLTTEIAEVGGVTVKPHHLLAAMAFQLGLWLSTADESIGQCEECGSTWVFGPGTGHRVNRRYCSSNCQDAARYRRKKSKLGALGGPLKSPTPVQVICLTFWAKKTAARLGRRSGSGGD